MRQVPLDEWAVILIAEPAALENHSPTLGKASSKGRRTLYCALGTSGRTDNRWRNDRRFWLSQRNEAWLVPDPTVEESDVFYRLNPGRVRVGIEPFVPTDCEIAAGLDRADAYFAAAWEKL